MNGAMTNRRTVTTGYGMMALERKDRERFNRLNETFGLKKPALKLCPTCVGRACDWYGTGVCLGGMK